MISKEIKLTKAYLYAESVLNGKQIACRFIKMACDRFMKDLERKDLVYDLDSVENVTHFFENVLCVPELGRSVEMPLFHAFWVQQLYGFKFKDTGLRRFTTVYNQFARKSAKTYYAGAITNFEALLWNDPRAIIMHGANSRDQAVLCTNMTADLINGSPQLKRFRISQREGMNRDGIILFERAKNTLKIVYQFEDRKCVVEAQPKDPGDGTNPSVGIVDEYHEAKDDSLLETIRSGQGLRLEPLTIVITSPGHNKLGPCYQTLRKKSVDVLNGKLIDDRHLAIMFELDSEEEWNNIDLKKLSGGDLSVLDVLEKSNPMMPYVPTLRSFLRDRVLEAAIAGGSTAANIKIKNAGIWIDAPNIWIPSKTIKKNNHGITEDQLIGRRCYIAIDLAASTDLCAVVTSFDDVLTKDIEFVSPDGSVVLKEGLSIEVVKSHFWIPEERLKNSKEDAVDYLRFVERGEMSVIPGDTIEYRPIANYVLDHFENYDVWFIASDSKYARMGIVPFLDEADKTIERGGYKGFIGVGQGFNLTEATSEVERLAMNHQFDFMGNQCMEMCFQNTTLHYKGMTAPEGGISGDRFPAKGLSNGRIDGVTALVTGKRQYLIFKVGEENKVTIIEQWN